MTKKASLLAD